ncbi:MAG: anthranilate phosphoribosyltransferase [Planctomycetota bacterium]
MDPIQQAADQVRDGGHLSRDTAAQLIDAMLRGESSDDAIAALLLALAEKGETVDELVGAAQAMRQHMTRIPHRHEVLLDTCGTGGSGSGTFNISTAVAIVVAACDVAVAKHGNRKATSHSGSADVLECLGVGLESHADEVSARLDRDGLCFCFAPALHPAMKHVVGVRRRLGVKTLFNLLGPLCNPAAATHQLLGTSSPADQALVAAAMAGLRTKRSMILHAEDGQDEVSLASPTTILDVSGVGRDQASGTVKPKTLVLDASDFGLSPVQLKDIRAADSPASAAMIEDLLDGQQGPVRDTVVAGAAVALLLCDRETELRDAVQCAAAAIDDGSARRKLNDLRRRVAG